MTGGYDNYGRKKDGRGMSYLSEDGSPLGYSGNDKENDKHTTSGSDALAKLALIALIIYGLPKLASFAINGIMLTLVILIIAAFFFRKFISRFLKRRFLRRK